MLLKNFYEIQTFTSEASDAVPQALRSVVILNPGHPVYLGHFPGNPVVPGICQVQMLKELVEKAVCQPLKLIESDNIKFLSMINPQTIPHLEFNIVISKNGDRQFLANGSMGYGETLFLKFKGKFEVEG